MKIKVKAAIEKVGTRRALAKLLQVNETTIWRWGDTLPPKYALLFKALCK